MQPLIPKVSVCGRARRRDKRRGRDIVTTTTSPWFTYCPPLNQSHVFVFPLECRARPARRKRMREQKRDEYIPFYLILSFSLEAPSVWFSISLVPSLSLLLGRFTLLYSRMSMLVRNFLRLFKFSTRDLSLRPIWMNTHTLFWSKCCTMPILFSFSSYHYRLNQQVEGVNNFISTKLRFQ